MKKMIDWCTHMTARFVSVYLDRAGGQLAGRGIGLHHSNVTLSLPLTSPLTHGTRPGAVPAPQEGPWSTLLTARMPLRNRRRKDLAWPHPLGQALASSTLTKGLIES